ncbi:PRC-barrel domain-containing protein [Azospirillum sp. sgz301742]
MMRIGTAAAAALMLVSASSAAQPGGPAAQPGSRSAAEWQNDAPVRILVRPAGSIAGSALRSEAGETVGRVDGVLIDAPSGAVRYLLVGSGGSLDIGHELVPVPWSAVAVDPGEHGGVRLTVDSGMLERVPRFRREEIRQLIEPDVIAQINDNVWTPGAPRAVSGSSGTADAPPRHAPLPATDLAPRDPVLLVQWDTVTTIAPPALVRPDTIRGTLVSTRSGELFGHIDRLMIDTNLGRIAFALIGHGGFLGLNEDWVPLPWQALSWSPGTESYVLQADAQPAPRSVPKQEPLPAMVEHRDLEQLYGAYGVEPYWKRG